MLARDIRAKRERRGERGKEGIGRDRRMRPTSDQKGFSRIHTELYVLGKLKKPLFCFLGVLFLDWS